MDELQKEIRKLKVENDALKKELQETKEHLKKYTFSQSHKNYKEKNTKKNINKIY